MRRRVLALRSIVVLGATLLSYSPDVDGNLDLLHEGDRLAHWDALQDGKLPFRDIYVQQGFGENILKPALACRLYGPSVEALRRIGQNAFLYRGFLPPLGVAATLIAVAVLSRGLLPLVFAAVFVLTGLCEATDRHMLGMVSIALAGMAIGRGRWWLVAAGACGAWAALYSLDVGLFVIAATMGWLVLDGVVVRNGPSAAVSSAVRGTARCMGAYLAGVVMGAVPFAIWCFAKRIAFDFARNVYTQLFLRGDVFEAAYPAPRVHPELSAGLHVVAWFETAMLFYVIPCLFAGGVIVPAFSRRDVTPAGRSRLLLCGLLGACFWTTVISRPDNWHVAATAPAFALLGAVMLEVAASFSRRRRAALVSVVVVCMIALGVFGFGGTVGRRWLGQESLQLPESLKKRGKTLMTADLPRVGQVAMEAGQIRYIAFMIGQIQELADPSDTILDLSDQGLLYFLSERRCPTRFHLKSHWGGSRELQRQMLDEVLRHENLPKCVIVNRSHGSLGDLLDRFVGAYYAPHAKIGPIEILKCVDPAAHRRGTSPAASGA